MATLNLARTDGQFRGQGAFVIQKIRVVGDVAKADTNRGLGVGEVGLAQSAREPSRKLHRTHAFLLLGPLPGQRSPAVACGLFVVSGRPPGRSTESGNKGFEECYERFCAEVGFEQVLYCLALHAQSRFTAAAGVGRRDELVLPGGQCR